MLPTRAGIWGSLALAQTSTRDAGPLLEVSDPIRKGHSLREASGPSRPPCGPRYKLFSSLLSVLEGGWQAESAQGLLITPHLSVLLQIPSVA